MDKFKIQNEFNVRTHSQATADHQQRIHKNNLKQAAKYQKDLQAFKENDFTDTSLADLNKHLSVENRASANFLKDPDALDQTLSFMEYQISNNLLANNSESTERTSRMTADRKAPLNKSLFNLHNISGIKDQSTKRTAHVSHMRGFNDDTSNSKDLLDNKSFFDDEPSVPIAIPGYASANTQEQVVIYPSPDRPELPPASGNKELINLNIRVNQKQANQKKMKIKANHMMKIVQ